MIENRAVDRLSDLEGRWITEPHRARRRPSMGYQPGLDGLRAMRSDDRPVSGKAGGYYGCLAASKRACENRVLVRRDLTERKILGAVRERISDADAIHAILREVERVVAEGKSDLPETIKLREAEFVAEQRRLSKASEVQIYDIVHLQHHYGVSWETVVYRLQNLGLISKDECDDFLKKKEEAAAVGRVIRVKNQDARPGKNDRNEDDFENRDFNARFFSLAMDAYRQEQISLSRLEELLELIEITPAQLKKVLKKIGIR